MGQLVRNKKGQYVKGVSGNPHGRPEGSKNVITYKKLLVEEAFRESQSADISKVLALIVSQAMEGDRASQKLVWDAAVSKQTLAEDKAVGTKQSITVHTMNVKSKDNEFAGTVLDGDYEVGEIVDDNQTKEILQ